MDVYINICLKDYVLITQLQVRPSFINDASGGSTGRLADQSGTSHITQCIAATNVNVNDSVLTITMGSGCMSTDKLWKH